MCGEPCGWGILFKSTFLVPPKYKDDFFPHLLCVVSRITAPKDVCILTPRTFDYVTLRGKRQITTAEFRLQNLTLDYPMQFKGPNKKGQRSARDGKMLPAGFDDGRGPPAKEYRWFPEGAKGMRTGIPLGRSPADTSIWAQ